MLNLRRQYFHPEDAVELRAFTHGLMPRSVPEMMAAFAEDWKVRGVDAWNEVPNHWRPGSDERVGWWSLPEYLGDHFVAPILGAPAGSCILMPNVHRIVEALLSCRELDLEGRRVVTTAAEFPSVLHTLYRWRDVYRFELEVVPLAADGFVDQEAVLKAIVDDTALAIVSHVGFTSGEILPRTFLRELAVRMRDVGGISAIDGYHATGSTAIDVGDLEVDVYFGGLLKEASGSSGNAYLYIRPGLDLSPRSSGWFGDAAPFAFGQHPADHPQVRRRFLSGTPAVASMYHAVEGLRILLHTGLERVREDSLLKTQQCVDRATDLGIVVRSPVEPARRGAMVILDVSEADRLCKYLKTLHIYTDSRKNRYLRMAPFVWNTVEDIDRAFDAVAGALRSGRHLRADLPAEAGPVT